MHGEKSNQALYMDLTRPKNHLLKLMESAVCVIC